MSRFLSEGLGDLIKGKWILWDTSAIIRVVDCEASELFDDLNQLGVSENITIKPVVLELGATSHRNLAVVRAGYIETYMTTILNQQFDSRHDKTLEVQEALRSTSSPGAIDLMLGSTLAQYGGNKKMLLITENIKDFPEPLYTKEGFVMVSNVGRSFGLTLLSMDTDKL